MDETTDKELAELLKTKEALRVAVDRLEACMLNGHHDLLCINADYPDLNKPCPEICVGIRNALAKIKEIQGETKGVSK